MKRQPARNAISWRKVAECSTALHGAQTEQRHSHVTPAAMPDIQNVSPPLSICGRVQDLMFDILCSGPSEEMIEQLIVPVVALLAPGKPFRNRINMSYWGSLCLAQGRSIRLELSRAYRVPGGLGRFLSTMSGREILVAFIGLPTSITHVFGHCKPYSCLTSRV